ncbi:unnamed protein product [Schistosoma curassoni]|uniref:DUF6451 domain-containing protein n=1 Tax=Schistosoma curassoni TaxID=6186 RepID=A0A183K9M1_9TREM|nr:unnamed protein product [Schistosoma curassoni]
MKLDDQDFADHLALLSQSQQQIQEKMTSVAAVLAAVGLNIHKGKSKILRYNTICTNRITHDREDLKDVKSFIYLTTIVNEHDGSDADVKARIDKASLACLHLKNIWNSKQLSTNSKVRIFNTNVKTVLPSNNITPNINFPICCLQVVDHHGNNNNNDNNNMTTNMMNIPMNNIEKQTLNDEIIESMYEKANDLLNRMKKRRKVLKNKQTKIQNDDDDCNQENQTPSRFSRDNPNSTAQFRLTREPETVQALTLQSE